MTSNDTAALDRSKPTILVVDTGLDERLINALHRRYDPPRGKGVNVVAITTAPKDWNGDFSHTLTNPRHLNNTNQWLFDKKKVNHLIVVKENAEHGWSSVRQLADEINALGLDIRGILSHPYNAFIDLEMAELCEQVKGLERYPTLAQVSTFKDKPTADAFLKMLKEKYNFDQLVTPWEATIESADGGDLPEGLEGLKELKRLISRGKSADYEEFIRAENDKAEEENWEITVKGKSVKIKRIDPLLGTDLKNVSQAASQQNRCKRKKTVSGPIPWKFFLKLVMRRWQPSAVELNSDLCAQEINKSCWSTTGRNFSARTRKSILQEFLGGIRLAQLQERRRRSDAPRIDDKRHIWQQGNSAHRPALQELPAAEILEKAIFPVADKDT